MRIIGWEDGHADAGEGFTRAETLTCLVIPTKVVDSSSRTCPRSGPGPVLSLTCLNCSSKLQFCCEVKLFWTGLPLPPPLCCEEGVGGCDGGRADDGDGDDVVTGGNARPPGGRGGGICGEEGEEAI